MSSIGVSGRTVLFCLLTRTQSRNVASDRPYSAATRALNFLYVSFLRTRKMGSSDGGMFLSSKEARSKPWCFWKVSSVMI